MAVPGHGDPQAVASGAAADTAGAPGEGCAPAIRLPERKAKSDAVGILRVADGMRWKRLPGQGTPETMQLLVLLMTHRDILRKCE